MAVFNVACFNPELRKPDPETGCVLGCGTRDAYEACRQSYFLKQQNEILREEATSMNLGSSGDATNQQLDNINSQLENMTLRLDLLETRVTDLQKGELGNSSLYYVLAPAAFFLLLMVIGVLLFRSFVKTKK